MADFIDFVVDCTKDGKLGKEFVEVSQSADGEELSKWFKNKGYDVEPKDAGRLIKKTTADDFKETVKGSTY